jgi:iron complex outermembrane receptor protein
MSDNRAKVAAVAALVLAGLSGEAVAQAVATADSVGLEEVVVTARKRDETLLTVPLSVTAFTAKRIEAEGITDLAGIAEFTPGFNIGNTGSEAGAEGGSHADRGTQNLIIRGIFNRASVFIDGAPISDGIVDGVGDLARVEVVKGPQSAYFGRATFIGALNLVTKDPGDEFKGSVEALYGSYNWRDFRVSLEGPIVDQKLALRISLRDYAMDGQYRNNGGAPDNYLGAQSTKSVDFDIVATPTDDLKVNLFGMFWNDSDGPGVIGKYDVANWNCNAGAAPKGTLNYYCGTLPAFNLGQLGQNTVIDPLFQSVILNNSSKVLTPILPNFDDHGGLERYAYHLHANINYDIESLGITVTSLTAFNQDHTEDITDIGMQAGPQYNVANPAYGSVPNMEPFIRWLFYYQDVERSDSEEVRVASDQSDRFRWTVGTNYTYSYSAYNVEQDSIFGGPLDNTTGAPATSSTIGAFFSAAYDIVPDLTLNIEGRWQADTITQDTRFPVVPSNGQAITKVGGQKTFYNIVPRAILQYKLTPDNMIYASYSEGVTPGGFNTALLQAYPVQLAGLSSVIGSGAAGVAYQPEKLDNYEIGIKGKLWDNRIQYSFDAYYAQWTNQQVVEEFTIPQVNNFGVLTGGLGVTAATTNIGKTILDGLETEGSVAVTPKFIVSWGGSYNNSDIRSYSCQSPCQSSITGSANVTGNMLPYYSKWSGTLGLEYTDELMANLDWYGRFDYVYKSGMFDTYSDTAKTQPTNRLNLHVGIKSGNTYSLEAFILNITNNLAPTSIERNVDVLNGFGNDINVGLPLKQQIGVKGHLNFGLPTEPTAPTTAYTPPPVQAVAPPLAVAKSYQVFFDFNKSDLTPEAVKVVDQAAANAAPAKVTRIDVTGHTDTVGSDAYNMRLSRRRAESVAAELQARGIPASEIAIFAKGKKDLLVPTADGVREPQNRRVQIVYEGGPNA